MPLRPRVLEVEAELKIRWLWSVFVGGLLDGEHLFMMPDQAQRKSTLLASVRIPDVAGVHNENDSAYLKPQ